jgi:hypothetical protein
VVYEADEGKDGRKKKKMMMNNNNRKNIVGSEVPTAVVMKSSVPWI